MKNILNIIFSFIIGGLPWINLVVLLSNGIQHKKSKQIFWSSLLLFLEITFLSIILVINFENQHFNLFAFLLFLTLNISFIYSIYTFIKNKNNETFSYLIMSVLSGIASIFYILAQLVIIVLAYNEKKYRWMIMPIGIILMTLLLVIGTLPKEFFALAFLFNLASILFWAIIAKNSYGIKLPAFKAFNVNPTPPSSSSRQSVTINHNKPVNNQACEDTAIFDKGWTVDDTLHISVDLMTIEDMINPLPLKNEHEKAIKDLTIYIRRISLYGENEISKTFGEKGFSTYLETHFSKIELDAVRSVYIKSLHLLLEDYSIRDPRIQPYLEKVLVK